MKLKTTTLHIRNNRRVFLGCGEYTGFHGPHRYVYFAKPSPEIKDIQYICQNIEVVRILVITWARGVVVRNIRENCQKIKKNGILEAFLLKAISINFMMNAFLPLMYWFVGKILGLMGISRAFFSVSHYSHFHSSWNSLQPFNFILKETTEWNRRHKL